MYSKSLYASKAVRTYILTTGCWFRRRLCLGFLVLLISRCEYSEGLTVVPELSGPAYGMYSKSLCASERIRTCILVTSDWFRQRWCLRFLIQLISRYLCYESLSIVPEPSGSAHGMCCKFLCTSEHIKTYFLVTGDWFSRKRGFGAHVDSRNDSGDPRDGFDGVPRTLAVVYDKSKGVSMFRQSREGPNLNAGRLSIRNLHFGLDLLEISVLVTPDEVLMGSHAL